MAGLTPAAPAAADPAGPPVMHWLWNDPAADPLLAGCIAAAGEDDCVVLQAEAALAALAPELWLAGRRGRWLVLLPDLHTLGLDPRDVAPDIECIDHAELVDLSLSYPLLQSWA